MSERDDTFRIQPGRIRDRGSVRKARSFVGQVLRAARQAGHTGYRFGRAGGRGGGSSFGRGRFAGAVRGLTRSQQRVMVKARVVRHRGARFRSAPLAKHIAYLKREGVTRDGREAGMFGPDTDRADDHAFAAACEADRHHFRFIVSPEEADRMSDLRGFTRDLMRQAEHDLGTRLDWIAADHWNTDNPHIHILLRGRVEDGSDLVIARDYISRGLRSRAEHRVGLELGPRTGREIATGLEAEVGAERWTGLDRALRALADDGAGAADLRPGAPALKASESGDPSLHRLMIGRAQTLERLGLAEQLAPAVWRLKPGLETTLREMGARHDIIKTMHRALAGEPQRAQADFAIEDHPTDPVLGRLVERGLHDELSGQAYAVIDGVDGRVHHLRLGQIDATGDTPQNGIVEARTWQPKTGGRMRLTLVGRSDLSLEAQIGATGATWLDRLALAPDRAPLSTGGFGAEVRTALDRRAEHLIADGLATRRGHRIIFARDLLATLRQRELDAAARRLAAETGLTPRKPEPGETLAGTYRRRLDLASGRFAMIDNGLGFYLVPWTPPLDRHLGRRVTGTLTPGGRVDWTFGRTRGPSR